MGVNKISAYIHFLIETACKWSIVLPFTLLYDRNMALTDFWEGKKDEHFFKSKIDSIINSKGQEIWSTK